MPLLSSAAIGVFDSGIGGLSVLRALQAQLPTQRFIYVADSRYAPYGERSEAFVVQRTLAVAHYLHQTYAIQGLVVACNTATAAAIAELRLRYPQWVLVGVEPALKPAIAASRTGRIGVLGTRGTLGSAKFARLLASVQGQGDANTKVDVVLQPCDGLAYAIERLAHTPSADPQAVQQAEIAVQTLCQRYTQALGHFGDEAGAMDTLVLGCTHYVFAQDVLRALVGPRVQLLETGPPVARQTQRLLAQRHTHSTGQAPTAPVAATAITTAPLLELLSTGQAPLLDAAAARWLLSVPSRGCCTVEID